MHTGSGGCPTQAPEVTGERAEASPVLLRVGALHPANARPVRLRRRATVDEGGRGSAASAAGEAMSADLACDEIAELRATLARMPQPLMSLAAVSYAATRDPLVSRAWNDLAQAARDVIAGRVRYGLDYLAGGDGNGTIYSAGPGDPPPTAPPT